MELLSLHLYARSSRWVSWTVEGTDLAQGCLAVVKRGSVEMENGTRYLFEPSSILRLDHSVPASSFLQLRYYRSQRKMLEKIEWQQRPEPSAKALIRPDRKAVELAP